MKGDHADWLPGQRRAAWLPLEGHAGEPGIRKAWSREGLTAKLRTPDFGVQEKEADSECGAMRKTCA